MPERYKLISELEIRNKMIAEESKAKYEAWRRIAKLEQEIEELKGKLKNDQ